MNTEWAIKELTKFIEGSTTHEVQYGGNTVGSYRATAAGDDDLTKQAQVVERILARVLPDWRERMREQVVHSMAWQALRDVCIRAREALEREDEIRANLGDVAPELSAAELHPWIWEGATSLWQSGHHREAVEGAIKKLNAETQNKVGRRDVSETALFQEAFSTDGPTPGKARLRRMTPDASDTYKSVQRGGRAFAEGVFAGIRNPLSHEADQELSEQEALEYLAALSVLTRWVDGSTVEVAS